MYTGRVDATCSVLLQVQGLAAEARSGAVFTTATEKDLLTAFNKEKQSAVKALQEQVLGIRAHFQV